LDLVNRAIFAEVSISVKSFKWNLGSSLCKWYGSIFLSLSDCNPYQMSAYL